MAMCGQEARKEGRKGEREKGRKGGRDKSTLDRLNSDLVINKAVVKGNGTVIGVCDFSCSYRPGFMWDF